jgi:hypothetical protein
MNEPSEKVPQVHEQNAEPRTAQLNTKEAKMGKEEGT